MKSQKPIKAKQLEKIIRDGVRNILRFERWYVINNFQGLGCFPGMSDLTAVKNGKVLFIELKTEAGKQSDKQLVFQKEIESRGGIYLTIRSVEQMIAYLKGKDDAPCLYRPSLAVLPVNNKGGLNERNKNK